MHIFFSPPDCLIYFQNTSNNENLKHIFYAGTLKLQGKRKKKQQIKLCKVILNQFQFCLILPQIYFT